MGDNNVVSAAAPAPSISGAMNGSQPEPPAGHLMPGSGEAARDREADNSVIRQMRATVDAAQREAQEARRAAEAAVWERQALAAEMKQLQDAQLSDAEGKEKELAELRPLRDQMGRYTNAFKQLYEQELAEVPESRREAVARLSQAGDWDQRLEQLRHAKSLLPPISSGSAPLQQMGTTTNPVARENPTEPPRLNPKNPPSLKQAFQMEPMRGPSFSSKQLAEIVKQQLEEVLASR